MTHSPEPWTAIPNGDRYEIDHDGNGSVIGCEGLFREDAERIVACVNFLRNIPTEVLEKYKDAPSKFSVLAAYCIMTKP